MGDIYSAYITIDNPVLLEILLIYKGLGLFAQIDPIFCIGEYGDHQRFEKVVTPAFDYYRDEYSITKYCSWPGCPEKISEVLTSLIELFQVGTECTRMNRKPEINSDVFKLLKEELVNRETEIQNAYIFVDWTTEWECSHRWTFTYNKIDGEDYEEEVDEEYDDEVDDDNEEEKGGSDV